MGGTLSQHAEVSQKFGRIIQKQKNNNYISVCTIIIFVASVFTIQTRNKLENICTGSAIDNNNLRLVFDICC